MVEFFGLGTWDNLNHVLGLPTLEAKAKTDAGCWAKFSEMRTLQEAAVDSGRKAKSKGFQKRMVPLRALIVKYFGPKALKKPKPGKGEKGKEALLEMAKGNLDCWAEVQALLAAQDAAKAAKPVVTRAVSGDGRPVAK